MHPCCTWHFIYMSWIVASWKFHEKCSGWRSSESRQPTNQAPPHPPNSLNLNSDPFTMQVKGKAKNTDPQRVGTRWTSSIILSWLWAGSSQNQGFLWACRRDSILSQLTSFATVTQESVIILSFFPWIASPFGNQSNQNLNTKPWNVAHVCPTGHSLQFIGKEIWSKREYNLLQKTQHLPAMYIMRLGETSKMDDWVRYPYVPVSMYPYFYISISGYIWPVF